MVDFTIKAIETEAEHVAARALSFRAFSPPEVWAQRTEDIPEERALPGFDFEWFRIGVADGQVVCNVTARPYRLRYGHAEITYGGIGSVCTDPAYQKRGYASAVMRDAIDYMLRRGDAFSLLDGGVEHFYNRLGYHTLWPYRHVVFSAVQAAELDAPLALRPATADDWPHMAALYEQQWRHRVGGIRDADWWRWHVVDRPPRLCLVAEARDETLAGYIMAGDSVGNEGEVIAATPEAARSLAAEVGRRRVAAGADEISWVVAVDDNLLHMLPQVMDCRVETKYFAWRGWMGRIIHLENFRNQILPEMLRVSGLDERGLIFTVQPQAIFIGLRGQDTTNVQLDHNSFLRLMLGQLPPVALRVHPDAEQLLGALFPPRVVGLAQFDHF